MRNGKNTPQYSIYIALRSTPMYALSRAVQCSGVSQLDVQVIVRCNFKINKFYLSGL